MSLRILGVDPGTVEAGWGVVEAGDRVRCLGWGVATASRKLPRHDRLKNFKEVLMRVVEEYSPEMISVEEAFQGLSPKTALRLGEARGVALLAASEAGLEVFEFSPREIKKSVTGSGSAAKEEVSRMVRAMLTIEDELPLDASDALAAALCLCHRLEAPF